MFWSLQLKIPKTRKGREAVLGMHWDRAELRALQGGYSGSLLLLAQGWKRGSQTEPVVINSIRLA